MTKLVISFPRGVEPMTLDKSLLSESTIDALLTFAIQARVSNAFASMAEKEGYTLEDWSNEAARHIAEAEANEMRFGTGGGGARIDAVERECRAIVSALLIKKGNKKAAADKAATKWRDVVPEAGWDKVLEKARQNVAARDLDVEL